MTETNHIYVAIRIQYGEGEEKWIASGKEFEAVADVIAQEVAEWMR